MEKQQRFLRNKTLTKFFWFPELKSVKYKHPEKMVFRKELPYDKTVDIMNIKYIAGSANAYTLPPDT